MVRDNDMNEIGRLAQMAKQESWGLVVWYESTQGLALICCPLMVAVCSSLRTVEDDPEFCGWPKQHTSTSISRTLIYLCLFHWPVLRRLGQKTYWTPSHLHLSFHEMKLPLVFLCSPPRHGPPSSTAFQSDKRKKTWTEARANYQPHHIWILLSASTKTITNLFCYSCLKRKTIIIICITILETSHLDLCR